MMANSLEYTLSCEVCFEEFEETGDHVPRLLPCTHTLCETCVGQMIQRDILECPECRQKHPVSRGRKSFPQNKYILVNIKRRPTLKDQLQISSKKPEVDLCDRHDRPKSLYCIEEHCQKLICPLCLKDEHRMHDFEDAQEILEEKRERFVGHIDSLAEQLLVNEERLLMAKEDAKKNRTECTEKITRAQDEQMKMMTQLYNQMITRVNINYKDISTNIDKTIEKIDENIRLLADIKESGKVVTSSKDIMATMDWTEINSNFLEARNFKVFQYHGYQFTLGDIRKWVGSLDSIDSPAVQLEPLQTLSLQTKAIKSASELQLQGNNSTFLFLPTAREGNVFTGVCHYVHNRPYGYSVTCYSAVGTHPT